MIRYFFNESTKNNYYKNNYYINNYIKKNYFLTNRKIEIEKDKNLYC